MIARVWSSPVATRPERGPKGPSQWSAVAVGTLTAVLFALAFPGGPLPWLAWGALTPLLWGLRRSGPGAAVTSFFLFAFLAWGSSIWWVVYPLHDISELSIPGALVVLALGCALFAVPYAVAGAVCSWWTMDGWLARSLRDAGVLTAMTHTFPLVFPGGLEHSQYRYPVVFQVLDLGGVPLLAFAIYLVNALLAEASMELGGRRLEPPGEGAFRPHWQPLGAAAGVLLLTLGYGELRLRELDADRAAGRGAWITVGAVQANLPIGVPSELQPGKHCEGNSLSTATDQARELLRRHPEVELLVFPEWPEWLVFGTGEAAEKQVAAFAAEAGRPLLVNVVVWDPPGAVAGRPGRYNAVAFMGEDGSLRGLYRKMVLIPGTETWPWEASSTKWLRWLTPESLPILKGREPVVFPVRAGVKVIPLLCYEGILTAHVRRFLGLGGNLLVNGANDTWFGRTPASEIHTALGLYRTAELRMPLLRVANSGLSVAVGADGRVLPGFPLPQYETSEGVARLFIPSRRSVYARAGDAFLVGLTVMLAIAAVWRVALAARSRSSQTTR
jgi:apolipoprotein N-acyltransferase